MQFSIIAAIGNNNVIGVYQYDKHELPWPLLKEDSTFFKQTTTGNNAVCIMGHNTYVSLPDVYKKNKDRTNIVISRSVIVDCYTESTFEKALALADKMSTNIYVIGGAQVYKSALMHPGLNKLYLTFVNYEYPQYEDVKLIRFPLDIMRLIGSESGDVCVFKKYHDQGRNIDYTITTCQISSETVKRINDAANNYEEGIPVSGDFDEVHDEDAYLNLVRKIRSTGLEKVARNDTVQSIFGYQLRFDLSKGYPLYTVKRCYPKSIFEELMWFIRGQTDVTILQSKGITIWNANSNKEYLEKYKLPHKEWDIGPGYGFQMRHHGAKYVDCHTDYTGQGVDQLQQCINLIKNEPESRRILLNLWNASDVAMMALPPCHIIYNFLVETLPNGKSTLNCHLFQRSWDVMLGWNTTTAALLTYILAKHCDLEPGILVHSITDVHLYHTHIKSGSIDQLCSRKTRPPPKLTVVNKHDNINDYEYSDIVLENYNPCPPIKALMIA